ncbi:uncharacterized protein AC631_00059 [Debaryomyces fabryi]|uniref:SH3 domain-containing protein n=1 Tax=Debaryomyces fabryi TaxID=58627 RepID=A0A0V1Q6Y3_9ASCO|nr:uncharacterized protein AC631_00059 [Debaryomyces fabryi]KSA04188.1 hypothetical protein AC631_00059 [Debaryomyces fabryi]CUM46245.1 unnamed protein product [Debaryomyces fabryi]
MSIAAIRKQKSIDEDLTILMTLTSTLTVSSLPASLVPKVSNKGKKSSTSTTLRPSYIIDSSSSRKTSTSLNRPKTLLSIPSALVSKFSLQSETTSDSARSTHTSEPYHSNLDNVAGLSKENNSLKLGLAIGIPIAIVSILVGIILAWFYLKKKTFNKRRNGLLPYKNEYLDHNNDENLTMKETKFQASSINLVSTKFQGLIETPVQIQRGPNQQLAQASVKNFFNRLSRTINIRNINDADIDTLNENKSGLVSPIFLKKFNLRKSVCKPNDVYNSEERLRRTNGLLRSIDADFLSIPYNDSTISISEKRSKKPLPKLPPIINTYKSKSLHDMEKVVTHTLLSSSSIINRDDKIYKVIKPYVKNLDDEISIKVGDKVKILTEHSDGWCFVKLLKETEYSNHTMPKQGVIPRLCLQKI